MLQDKQGFLWFGTEDGLNRYDGYRFQVFKADRQDPSTLSDSWISALLEDRDGRLWVATRFGLDLYQRTSHTFKHIPLPSGEAEAWSLYEDRDGVLWYGNDHGVYVLDHEMLQSYDAIPQLQGVPVKAIFQDRQGIMWFGTGGEGLIGRSPDGAVMRFIHDPHDTASLSHDHVRAVFEDDAGRLWVGTERGLNRLAADRRFFDVWRHDPDDQTSLSDDYVTHIYEDAEDVLWIGTRFGGLNRLHRKSLRFDVYRHDPGDPKSLSHDTVWCVLEDRSRTFWIGSGTGGGLNKGLRSHFIHYDHQPQRPDSLSSNQIWSIYKDSQDGVWVGSVNGLDYVDRQQGVTVYFDDTADGGSLPHRNVWAIEPAGDGRLWLGFNGGGLGLFNPHTRDVLHHRHDPNRADSLSSDSVYVLTKDAWGRLWVGTNGGGLNRFDGTSGFLRYDEDVGLSHDAVWSLATTDRYVWIGTNGGGLNRLDLETEHIQTWRASTTVGALKSDRIWSLAVAENGVLWAGSKESGLYALAPNTRYFRHYHTGNSDLPNDTIYAILEDGTGHLWLSSNQGLSRFNPRSKQCRNFGVAHGLQSREFNLGAAYRAPDGEMFFGGINGINAFNPETLDTSPPAQPVRVTAFYTYDQEADLKPGSINLSHRDNFFSFEFAQLDYRNPAGHRYAYYLDGVDKDWREVGADQRIARYTFVPPGRYEFRIKGRSEGETWSAETVIPLIIQPPVYGRWWFWPSAAGLVLMASTAMMRRRLTQKRELARLLRESRDRERYDLAEHLHDGPIQELNVAMIHLSAVIDPQKQRVTQDLARVETALRNTCADLQPRSLKEFGLAAAIEEYVETACDMREWTPEIELPLNRPSALPRPVSDNLFRVFRKGFDNALNHAEATCVNIALETTEKRVVMTIADNGKGFHWRGDFLAMARNNHFGLAGMAERMKTIGGELTIQTEPGQGVTIRATAPLPAKSSPRRRSMVNIFKPRLKEI